MIGIRRLERELLILRHEVHQLKAENLKQEQKIVFLVGNLKLKDQDIGKLLEENRDLRTQLNNLQDKLNINSRNSGLPTSKEIYRIEKNSKPKSGLKPGGQPGRQYKGYEFKTPDKIVDIFPQETQCVCGEQLEVSKEYSAHQKIEIPPIKPFVIEYRLRSSCCRVCSKQYKSGLGNYKLLGKNAESIITCLGGFVMRPKFRPKPFKNGELFILSKKQIF